MSITIIIVAVTSVISILAFQNQRLFDQLKFNPYHTYHNNQWYRIFTHGFLHADWLHLIVNMLVLYSFGQFVESYFAELHSAGYMGNPSLIYLLFYVAAIVVSSLTTLFKQKDNEYYNSVGASGAVSAVLFISIFFAPWQKLLFYAIIPIPGIIFGVLYLAYSQYMSKKGADNINHDAHIFGALFGFLFPLLIDFSLWHHFINSLMDAFR